MTIYEVILFAVSISLLALFMSVSGDVQSLKAQISNDNGNAQILNQRMSDLETEIKSIKLSKPFMNYEMLFADAPEVLPPLPLTTITATSVEALMPALTVNSLYEITKMGGSYFLAYPSTRGAAFSIQILSSSYPDRVMKIIRTLRGEGVPAFEIPYENTNGLFVGVFPNYAFASEYASSISETIRPTVGSTSSSWLIRQIP